MKISYVMIVLNGMPFIEFSLKAIYDFAYEIVIVEGAIKDCMFAANLDGSSKDGTSKFIKSFSDPENKIRIIQGKWADKCKMQNQALGMVTGDYIWLVDSDEVYKKEDINIVIKMLECDPTITQINFPVLHFWKGFDYILASKILKGCWPARLFKLDRPCFFTSHRPPTLFLRRQRKTTFQINFVSGDVLEKKGIYFYHYSYILETQVRQKIELYKKFGWDEYWKIDLDDWFSNCFLKWSPENRKGIEKKYSIWTGDPNSRTELFRRGHPKPVIDYLRNRKYENVNLLE